jgi:hypothetical protein
MVASSLSSRVDVAASRSLVPVQLSSTMREVNSLMCGLESVTTIDDSLTIRTNQTRQCTRVVPRQRLRFSFDTAEQNVGVHHRYQEIVLQEVLRICKAGHRRPPRLTRISGDFRHGGYRAVRGDALIHGPYLAAGPVGSEWRTRRPYQASIQSKQQTGD